MKRIIGTSLVWLGNGLIGLALLVVLTGIIFGWYTYGFSWVRETLSPFNIWNLIATMIVLAPGIGIRLGGQKLVDMARTDALRQQ
jgi:hypothetical protein